MIVVEQHWQVQQQTLVLWPEVGGDRKPSRQYLHHRAPIQPDGTDAPEQQTLRTDQEIRHKNVRVARLVYLNLLHK